MVVVELQAKKERVGYGVKQQRRLLDEDWTVIVGSLGGRRGGGVGIWEEGSRVRGGLAEKRLKMEWWVQD